MKSNISLKENRLVVIIIGSLIFGIAFVFQMKLANVPTFWNGIIAQIQVLTSIYMVFRVPGLGRVIASIFNIILIMAISIHFTACGNSQVLPGIFVAMGTIITIQIIGYYNKQLIIKNQEIIKEKTDKANEIIELQDMAIMSMAALAETRDNETGKHIQRTKLYVKVLTEYLLEKGEYCHILNSKMVTMIVASAALHDIGKVGIPDSILLKPGKLNVQEFEVIKQHTILGFETIMKAEKLMEEKDKFLKYAGEIILYHHERFDGMGYLYGLKGEEIPLSARIMSVADVYDALTDKRVYKERFSHNKAFNIIKEESGKQFDPVIVDAFIACHETFKMIAEKYRDDLDE
ncbi:HD-GYP domain-containing protein [Clostridium sp. DL1XJH146]